MRLRRNCLLLSALILVIMAVPVWAARTTFRYDAAQRVVKACVLGMPGQVISSPGPGQTLHPNPYVIEGLRRSDLVPDDWVFENPLAPPTVIAGEVPGEFAVKGTREYWFVPLTDETAWQLTGMDLIYICAPELNLTFRQSEGLRAAVEAGAVLWVDNDISAGGTVWTNFPWVFEFADLGPGPYTHVALDGRHGLLTDPFYLSDSAVALLGDLPDWADYTSGVTAVGGEYITNLESIFTTVVQTGEVDASGQVINRLPFVAVASYGSGSIVLTTGGVGRDVAEWLGAGSTAPGYVAGRRPSPNGVQAPDVKLALNMIQWNDRWEQARRTPRATATSVARAPGPLDILWQYPDTDEDLATKALGAVVSTPVYNRGMLYAVSVPSTTGGVPVPARLTCLDITPERSLDGDAWPDDGFGDYSVGTSYDVVWQVDLGAGRTPRYSSPTLATINVPGSGGYDVPIQVVLVSTVTVPSTTEGYVTCYNATIDPEILAQVPAPYNTPGAVIWERTIQGYGGTGEVVALSTPVVHNGFVYVLASEFDSTLPGPPPEQTYGRVHCFQLDFDWTSGNPDDAGWWVYPSSETDLDGVGGPGVNREEQRSLPPFHDPTWVMDPGAGTRPMLPPAPGAIPVVHASGGTVLGGIADALVTFGTPVTFTYDEGLGRVTIDTSSGGCQFCVVPAPLVRSTGQILLNEDYFLLPVNTDMVNNPADITVLAIDGATPVPDEWFDVRHRRYAPGAVREAIADATALGGDPIEMQTGVDVLVTYHIDATNTVNDEPHRLMGPVRWRRPLPVGQSIQQPASMSEGEVIASGGAPISYTAPPPVDSGGFTRMDASTGAVKWSYDPVSNTPQAMAAPLTGNVTSAAFDAETAVVGATTVDYTNSQALSSIIGLSRQMEATVRLGYNPPNGLANSIHVSPAQLTPTTVRLAATGDVISPMCYRIDRWSRHLTFPAETAGNVRSATGTSLGPIYGKTILVDWTHDNGTPDDVSDDAAITGEMHVVPDIERFHHTYQYIRLRHRPVNLSAGPVVLTRKDGTLLAAGSYGMAGTVVIGGATLSLDGWVNIGTAVDVNGVPVRPGDELRAAYVGWSETSGTFITIPNATLNLGWEHHFVPEQFGPSLSSPAMAGDTIHVGTQGLDTNLDGVLEAPQGRTVAETMLSLIWNRATGTVRSSLAQPARPQAGTVGVPVVTSSPSVDEDRVFVGVRMMDSAASQDTSYGYVSALAPWRVLLCDTDRIVETTGSEPSWVCTGTSSPQRAQSFVGEDLRRPFNRPARARRLHTGNILVVDSGNNRVVEIDRAGRLIWPLDQFGYEYYTSPDNHDLSLSRPADAYRYWDVEAVDTDGDGTPDRNFGVVHTVIADTGNARVIDVETRFYDPATFVLDGRQRHTVRRLTPTYVRAGTGPRRFVRVRYVSAQPIFDPVNNNLIGYLCAASNLNQILVVAADQNHTVNPMSSVYTPNGSPGATWSYWAWLYDPDPTDSNYVSNRPLQFENIKHVEYRRYGSRIYVTITCSRYVGRAGSPAHPLAAEGPGVFEFIIDVSDANPANWGLDEMGTGAPWPTEDPHWYFVGADYRGRPMTTITTAAGTPQQHDYDKRWFPVSALRLRSGDHLIVNSLSQIENATHHNIGAGAQQAVLGSHIFEVSTNLNNVADPTDDTHILRRDRSVPAPGETWADPFTQPTYAEVW